jgi:hypothetical protein
MDVISLGVASRGLGNVTQDAIDAKVAAQAARDIAITQAGLAAAAAGRVSPMFTFGQGGVFVVDGASFGFPVSTPGATASQIQMVANSAVIGSSKAFPMFTFGQGGLIVVDGGGYGFSVLTPGGAAAQTRRFRCSRSDVA